MPALDTNFPVTSRRSHPFPPCLQKRIRPHLGGSAISTRRNVVGALLDLFAGVGDGDLESQVLSHTGSFPSSPTKGAFLAIPQGWKGARRFSRHGRNGTVCLGEMPPAQPLRHPSNDRMTAPLARSRALRKINRNTNVVQADDDHAPAPRPTRYTCTVPVGWPTLHAYSCPGSVVLLDQASRVYPVRAGVGECFAKVAW